MSCDICGEQILGKPMKVIVEGAKVIACRQCAKLGKPYYEPPPPRIGPRILPPQRSVQSTRPDPPKTIDDFEVVDDFSARIRRAREKVGLTQQDLAKRVKEKLSLIQKIEAGKITPNMRLCRELEHSLRIILLAPKAEIPLPTTSAATPNVTLGDIVKVKRKE